MDYVDTHCHIHDSEFAKKFDKSPEQMLGDARNAGLKQIVCVGTSLKSSIEAVAFAEKYDDCYASIALHPHEAERLSEKEFIDHMEQLETIKSEKIIAIGECGLDYFYHDDTDVLARQEHLFRQHLELAVSRDLPMIFHVRGSKNTKSVDAFEDFFALIDSYNPRGVVHSFSAGLHELQGCLQRNLYVGLNGIMTFTTDELQLAAAKNVPINNLLIETDAPYLTPNPFRGTINEPKRVINITKFLSELRDEPQALLAKQTTQNAKKLFKFN